jgi:MFS family permease
MRAFALQRLAANLGFSFGPFIGGMLAKINFGLLFAVDALTTLGAAMALLVFFRMRQIETVPAESAEPAAVRSPLRDGVFVSFLLLMLASMMVFCQFGTTYPLYLQDHFGLDTRSIGLMFAVNTTVIVAVEMLLLDAIKHWPLVRTIGWGCFLFCMGWGILPFGVSAGYAVLAMLIVTIGEMLSFSMATAFVANRSGVGGEGAYMSWYMVMHAAAAVLGPAVGATIYQYNRDALWYVALAAGVLVLGGFRLLARRVREPEVAKVLNKIEEPSASPLIELQTAS